MSKRKQDSSAESLADALSRVMVTREELDHRETYEWATTEGRGDRMPRFLERAIQDVPHASRRARVRTEPVRYQGRSRLKKVTFLMSLMGIGTGVAISFAPPERVAPWVNRAQIAVRLATANFAFTSDAVAATPRLRFGEALRNYSEQAAAQAARANIVVSNLTPGATLSAGEQVSATEWSLPQSDLENLVITFPSDVPESGMRATVEIPGNTKASSGKFSVELRRADEAAADATLAPPETPASEAVAEPVQAEDKPDVDEPVRKAKTRSGDAKALKRKSRPSAALPAKQQPGAASSQKVATVSPATNAGSAPAARASASAETGGDSGGPSLFGSVFSSFAGGDLNANALTMNALSGSFPQ
jgi:hypothetical protein